MIDPDVFLGFKLEDCISQLKKHNYKYSIIETISPRKSDKTDECRVIKVQRQNNEIKLTVSYF